MSGFFLAIVNMSISASWIVLAVLLIRLLLKKAPKWITVLLWGIVGIRLICPFSIESVMSLIPSAETISKAPDAPRPHFESGVTIVDNQVNDYLQGHYFEGVTRPTGYFVDITTILAIVWIVGIVVLLTYTIISYLRVKNKIGTAVLLRDNIFQSENVVSPFVLGVIKPKIYLPFNMNEQDMAHVIAHENAHIRRKDHLWKPLGFLILALHWFNPLMWLGYVLLCRDIELACDEKVVKGLDTEQRADYSQALLTCSVNRRMIAACPLAFGEVGVKDRVKSVLNYKKPAFWVILIAIVASVVTAVCFLTNPIAPNETEHENSENSEDISNNNSDAEEIIKYQIIDEEKLGNYQNCAQYYDTKGSSQTWKILIESTEDLKNFRFIELDDAIVTKVGDTLFELDTLKANEPVLLHTYINDVTLNRGISYQDDTGVVHFLAFSCDMSGKSESGVWLKDIGDILNFTTSTTTTFEESSTAESSTGESSYENSENSEDISNNNSDAEEIIKYQIIDEEELGNYQNCVQYYDTKGSSQTWKILIESTEDLKNFRFIELDDSIVTKVGDTLFELDTLKANEPVLLHTYINDVTLNRGISYQDDTGVVHFLAFSCDMSGKSESEVWLKDIGDILNSTTSTTTNSSLSSEYTVSPDGVVMNFLSTLDTPYKSDKNYTVYTDEFSFLYTVKDNNGNVLDMGYHDYRGSFDLYYQGARLVLNYGYGGNLWSERYYDVENGRISAFFSRPVATSDTRVAYFTQRQEDGKIVLIVQDIFDPSAYSKEIERDFSSDVYKIVCEAEFLENSTKLQITYPFGEPKKGEAVEYRTEILSLF